MKSADAPYSLVLSCADALTEMVKARALVDQAESFRPKLGELRDFLANYSEVRNELGKLLSSGRLTDKDLTLVRENLLLLSALSSSLNALAADSENQLRKNLPVLADEMADAVSDWQAKAFKTGTADLDDMLKSGRALENDISLRFKKASELDSRLCCCRSLIENNKSLSDGQHVILKTATDLLAEAKSTTAEKLNRLLTKSKKWCDDHEAFSKEYEDLIQLLTNGADEIDQIMTASSDDCRRSLADYYGQIESWLAEVRMFLSRATKISSQSALGEHSKLSQFYSDSQNLIENLRSKIAEHEAIFEDAKLASTIKAARERNFIIAVLGTFGAGIGFVWLSGYGSMFAVAAVIAVLSFLSTRGENDEESSFWSVSMVLAMGLCAVGLLFMGASWLISMLFDSWSLINWLPEWVVAVIPLTFGAILTLGYAVIMCGLVFRNFLPIRRKKPQALQPSQNEFSVEEPEPFYLETEAMQPSNGDESRLTPPPTQQPAPPPLPTPSKPSVNSTTRAPTRPAIIPPPLPKAPAQSTYAASSDSGVETSCRLHLPEAEIPPQLLSRIRERVKREYRGDSESQHSEMESQMESYRALQDVVAQPPDGLDVQTLAKIVSRAQREHPLDLQMQLHEVEQQIEGYAKVEHFSDSANYSDVPSGILNKIIRKAKREYSNDFSLQSHELQEQMSAYIKITEMRNSPPPGVNRKQIAKAIADAEREYPDDYSMQVYHIEQVFEDNID